MLICQNGNILPECVNFSEMLMETRQVPNHTLPARGSSIEPPLPGSPTCLAPCLVGGWASEQLRELGKGFQKIGMMFWNVTFLKRNFRILLPWEISNLHFLFRSRMIFFFFPLKFQNFLQNGNSSFSQH